jgi:hypothetical protein
LPLARVGSFKFDQTYGSFTDLAFGSSSAGNNMMVTTSTFSANVVVRSRYT